MPEISGIIRKSYFKTSVINLGKYCFMLEPDDGELNRHNKLPKREKFVASRSLAVEFNERCKIGSHISFEYEEAFSANRVVRVISWR